MNNLKISLKDLRNCPEQKLHLSLHESIEEQSLTAPVEGDIFLAANSTSVRLAGTIQATAKLACARCLSPFLQSMEIDLDEEFVYEDYLNVNTSRGKDRELQKEDFFETVPYDGDLDVSDIVYQAIILAIPSYCACSPNCTGPSIYNNDAGAKNQKPGTSGADRLSAIDPRWHNLKTIFLNDTQNKKVRDNNL